MSNRQTSQQLTQQAVCFAIEAINERSQIQKVQQIKTTPDFTLLPPLQTPNKHQRPTMAQEVQLCGTTEAEEDQVHALSPGPDGVMDDKEVFKYFSSLSTSLQYTGE